MPERGVPSPLPRSPLLLPEGATGQPRWALSRNPDGSLGALRVALQPGPRRQVWAGGGGAWGAASPRKAGEPEPRELAPAATLGSGHPGSCSGALPARVLHGDTPGSAGPAR